MADTIQLSGISCFGYHGRHEEERRLGQRFLVDLGLALDLSAAARDDDINLGVDYSAAVRLAREVVEGDPLQLIEAVAERVAAQLLTSFQRLESVSVTIHKPHAPIAGPPVEDVSVHIRRARTQDDRGS